MKKSYSIVLLLFITGMKPLIGQFGYGLVISNDLYHRYTNPQEDGFGKSAGSAVLNLSLGPKIWIGGPKFSVSAEAAAGIGFLGFALKDYKGLGTAQFPILCNLNFGGVSTFDSEMRQGFILGGGMQYTMTELYGLDEEFAKKGVVRKLFPTYVGQVGYGMGISGFAVSGLLRLGYHPDNAARTLSVVVQWDLNKPLLKNIKSKASSL